VAYRARKFARHYRGPLITLCAFVLVLMVAAGVSIRQSIVAGKQRDRADAETAVAKAVNQFLQDDLLSQANPESQNGAESKLDPDIKARTLLDRAAAQAGIRFAQQPLVESEIQHTIGKAYNGLGLYKQAEQHLHRAYELSAAHRGADDPETLDILMAGPRPKSIRTKTMRPWRRRKLCSKQNPASLARKIRGRLWRCRTWRRCIT
jgi:hypothetical protein